MGGAKVVSVVLAGTPDGLIVLDMIELSGSNWRGGAISKNLRIVSIDFILCLT